MLSEIHRIECGSPGVLAFRGPDAVRFLNGQLTQDVRLVEKGGVSLPSCVTDAKGRLQFRVWLTMSDDGALWVEGPAGPVAEIEGRLTRYLIADDVEVIDLTGKWSLAHFTGAMPDAPKGVMTRDCSRYGVAGTDWWIPAGLVPAFPAGVAVLEGDALEAMRISNGVPVWGRELAEGTLPPEAGLDASDVSYHKGCYIGQEVISRIKSAGKVNKRLARLSWDAALPTESLELVDATGKPAGQVTSVSPLANGAVRHALGYVKRGVEQVFVSGADGCRHEVECSGAASGAVPGRGVRAENGL